MNSSTSPQSVHRSFVYSVFINADISMILKKMSVRDLYDSLRDVQRSLSLFILLSSMFIYWLHFTTSRLSTKKLKTHKKTKQWHLLDMWVKRGIIEDPEYSFRGNEENDSVSVGVPFMDWCPRSTTIEELSFDLCRESFCQWHVDINECVIILYRKRPLDHMSFSCIRATK